MTRRRWVVVYAVVLGAVGLALRVQLMSHQPIDSDQAITGLMAMQILHGHLYTFFWGNQYGGGEFYVVAAMFWLFGVSPTALTATSTVVTAVAAVLLGRVAAWLRPGRPLAAVVAAGAFWIWPEVAVWNSTREYGFRELTMAAGVAAILFTVRLLERRSLLDAAGLGMALGIGWWSSPEIGYFAIAVVVAMVLALSRRGRRPPVAAAAVVTGTFALGALPWLWANARTGLASLQAASSPTYGASTYGSRLHLCLTKALPMALGLRMPGSGAWLGGHLGEGLYLAGAGLVVVACLLGLLRAVRPGREVHAGCCAATLAFPFAYSAFPATSFWLDGHYVVFVVPLLVLAVIGSLPQPGNAPAHAFRRALAVGAGGAITAVLAATTFATFDRQFLNGHPTAFWRQPGDPEGPAKRAAGALERAGVTVGFANYWVAYHLDLISGGRLQLADPAADRWVAQYRRVRSSPNPAWVFYNPAMLTEATATFTTAEQGPFGYPEQLFLTELTQLGVGYRVVHAGPLDVVVTARKVDQASVHMTGPIFGG